MSELCTGLFINKMLLVVLVFAFAACALLKNEYALAVVGFATANIGKAHIFGIEHYKGMKVR